MLKSIIDFFKIDKTTLIVILVILFVKSFIYNISYVPTGSMKPTVDEKSVVLVNVHAYGVRIPFTKTVLFEVGKPERGDIAIFRSPPNESVNYLKRIVGIPGDTVYYNENSFSVNIMPESMPKMRIVVVPEGKYFAIGDNIEHSFDSRYWGVLPAENLVGRYEASLLELSGILPKDKGVEFNQEQKDILESKVK